jgi:urease accessory protein
MKPSDLPVMSALPAPRWDARLSLGYALRGAGRSTLVHRLHRGPLRVQRDFYPEGLHTCHNIVVHPPGGIVGGDQLALEVNLAQSSAALLTTPGAGKWYRSAGMPASQHLQFTIGRGASLEWLPQETIVFNGAIAQMQTEIHLDTDARYLGWEILCLGRTARAETFQRGRLQQHTQLFQCGQRLWTEQAQLEGDDPVLHSALGLDGHPVCATLIAAGVDLQDDTLAALRAVTAGNDARCGVTRLPRLTMARWLGDSSEQARHYCTNLWQVLRPAMRGVAAVVPRIWAT